MFNFFKKNKENIIVSPLTGEVVPITEVPDQAFSDKILGDGVAIIPEDGKVVSPVNGTVVQITDTFHAYGIQTEDGMDVLIHIGIDTVELKGEGFKCLVSSGQKVKAGEPIAEVDLDLVKEKGHPIHTPVVITNPDDAKKLSLNTGKAIAGETTIVKYCK